MSFCVCFLFKVNYFLIKFLYIGLDIGLIKLARSLKRFSIKKVLEAPQVINLRHNSVTIENLGVQNSDWSK
jgi:hypothetical protein